jgi:molybdenum cofactor cytidylyltransferase
MVRVSAILLAAGESKRMGVDKLLLPWEEKTILMHCVHTLLRSKAKEVIVVLSDRTKGMESQLKGRRVKVVMNPHYRRGMSTSIQKGIRATDFNSQGILIALGDMPFLLTRTVNALIRAFAQEKGEIIVPSFQGKQGHPVIFHKRFKKELLQLKGDVGGRSIIERHPEVVRLVFIKSTGVIKDIDTWKDFKKQKKTGVKDSGVQGTNVFILNPWTLMRGRDEKRCAKV